MEKINKNEEYEVILDKLYVSVSYLVKEFKIPQGSIDNKLRANRINRTSNWMYVECSYDKRKRLVEYSSIPSFYYKKYHLPNEELLFQQFKMNHEKRIKQNAEIKNTEIFHYFEVTYRSQFRYYLKHYYAEYRSKEKSELYSKTHAILVLIIGLCDDGHELKDLHKYFLRYKLSVKATNRNSFYRLIRRCKTTSIDQVVKHGLLNIQRKYKITIIHEKILKSLYRNNQKFSMPIIFNKANRRFIELEIGTLSLSTIKLYLSQNEIQNMCNPFRFGRKWAEQNLEHYVNKININYPGEQWQIDGSKFQFKYLSADNSPSHLYYFIILDSFSKKIVGYSISDSENEQLIQDAIINAIESTGYLPKEMVSDNAKPFYGKKLQQLKIETSCLGMYWRNSKIGNPRDKGKVERFVNTFQTAICSKEYGFIGEGVKSRRKNFTVGKEQLTILEMNKNLRSKDELKRLFISLIEEYNQTEINNKPSANTLHISKKSSPTINLSPQLKAKILWNETEATMRNNLIRIDKDGVQFLYKLDDVDLSILLNGLTFKVYSSKINHSISYLFNIDTDQYITSLRQDVSIGGLSYVVSKQDSSEIIKNADKNKKLHLFIDNEKENDDRILKEEVQNLIAAKAGINFKKIRDIESVEHNTRRTISRQNKSKNDILERMKNPYFKKGSMKIISKN